MRSMCVKLYRAAGQYDSALPNMELDKTLPSFTGDDYTWHPIAMAYDENGNYDSSKVRSGALWWKRSRTYRYSD